MTQQLERLINASKIKRVGTRKMSINHKVLDALKYCEYLSIAQVAAIFNTTPVNIKYHVLNGALEYQISVGRFIRAFSKPYIDAIIKHDIFKLN